MASPNPHPTKDETSTREQSETVVELQNIRKEFGSTTAVDDVSFEVKDGEFFTLLGPSGCGKTTTLRIIAGFENPTSGTIRIDGRDAKNQQPYDRDIGLVFQNYALFTHKTVAENVGFGLKMKGYSKEERKEPVEEYLDLVELSGFGDRDPKSLSGGQQQRVALARSLVVEPSVLLLDEPLSNLDLKLRKEMRFELQRIQDELDITFIYVTHDQKEALSMSDRLMVLNHGDTEQIGTPSDLYSKPANRFVSDFIGETNLLDGEITGVATDVIEIQFNNIQGTYELPISQVAEENETPNIGQPVEISIRPEDIKIEKGDASFPNSSQNEHFTGEIIEETYLGKTIQMLVTVDSEEILVETSKKDRISGPDKSVKMTWETNAALIFLNP